MEAVTLAYLVGFSAVYLVTVIVILNFASTWRQKMKKAQNDSRTKSVRRLVRLNEANADVQDALAYQKRTNEAARARIRNVEEEARDNAEHAERNSRMLRESRESNAKLASEYVAGTSMLGTYAQGISDAADHARRQSFSRAKYNTGLLRKLENDIDSMIKGAATPADLKAEVTKIETELAQLRQTDQEASAEFSDKVDKLLSATEQTQKKIGNEISALYITKEEADFHSDEFSKTVENARTELESQYDSVLETAEDVEAKCGIRNIKELDNSKLDQVQSSYDDLLAKLAEYTEIIDENENEWSGLASRLSELEDQTESAIAKGIEQNEEVDKALSDLDEYIKSNCTSADSVNALESSITNASTTADDLRKDLDKTRILCEGAKATCEDAETACTAAQGAAAINLKDGGVINVENTGSLSLKDGSLEFCNLENVCHNLTSSFV